MKQVVSAAAMNLCDVNRAHAENGGAPSTERVWATRFPTPRASCQVRDRRDDDRRLSLRDSLPPAFIVVSANMIAERAYAIYFDRGCQDGFDREDWFQAERELTASVAVPTAVTRPTSKKPRRRV
jgi:Protein of unknown function (DUF2934)